VSAVTVTHKRGVAVIPHWRRGAPRRGKKKASSTVGLKRLKDACAVAGQAKADASSDAVQYHQGAKTPARFGMRRNEERAWLTINVPRRYQTVPDCVKRAPISP
jgi:hypothetical protein